MAISAQQLTIYLYSAHRAVIFAIAQLSCLLFLLLITSISKWTNKNLWRKSAGQQCAVPVRIINCLVIKTVYHAHASWCIRQSNGMTTARRTVIYSSEIAYSITIDRSSIKLPTI